jgi:hypothetical protein
LIGKETPAPQPNRNIPGISKMDDAALQKKVIGVPVGCGREHGRGPEYALVEWDSLFQFISVTTVQAGSVFPWAECDTEKALI